MSSAKKGNDDTMLIAHLNDTIDDVKCVIGKYKLPSTEEPYNILQYIA